MFSTKYGDVRKLKPSVLHNGYPSVMVRVNGKSRRFTIHRLVARTFIPNVGAKETVNHKNGVKTDCRATNLEWCTRKENSQHALRTGLWVPRSKNVGENNSHAKLTADDVRAIRKLAEWGWTGSEIGAVYMIDQSTARDAIVGNTWKHIPKESYANK